MRVVALALQDFRNYERLDLELAPAVNLIVGRNAQGKTNLLEAVHVASGLGSPRGSDAALVRQGAERALVHAVVIKGERQRKLDLEVKPGRGTRALVNGTPVQSVRRLAEVLVCVYFGPDDLALVKGGPDERRRFLDDFVVKLRPAREPLRREWERVLKQRNALLKSAPSERGARAAAIPTLEVWDEALARAGAALTKARLDALEALRPFVRDRYASIAGAGWLDVAYASEWIDPDGEDSGGDRLTGVDEGTLFERLRRRLEEVRPRELERRVSLAGPQRDDLVLRIALGASSLDARTHASQGDQRTVALALKLGEHDLLTDTLEERPVLLLDDVFSELDPQRRAWLAETVSAGGQTFVSSAEPLDADAVGEARVIHVADGEVVD